MKRTSRFFSCFFAGTLLSLIAAPQVSAQEANDTAPAVEADAAGEQADLAELRTLREGLTEAVLAADVEKQIGYVAADVVTIWQNNQVAVGHDGLREFLSQIKEGDKNIFQGYVKRPASDRVTILPGGNAAFAYGSSVPHYNWLGLEFDLENRWSAMLLKTEEGWKLASYHVSGNIVDNPLLSAAKQMVTWAAVIALLLGMVLGLLISKLLGKRRREVA